MDSEGGEDRRWTSSVSLESYHDEHPGNSPGFASAPLGSVPAQPMDRLGDDVMKFRWTVSLAALALVAGILPAIAQQSTQNQPKSQDRQKIDRKIDAAAATPFMTKHQGDVLKGDLDKGEEM